MSDRQENDLLDEIINVVPEVKVAEEEFEEVDLLDAIISPEYLTEAGAIYTPVKFKWHWDEGKYYIEYFEEVTVLGDFPLTEGKTILVASIFLRGNEIDDLEDLIEDYPAGSIEEYWEKAKGNGLLINGKDKEIHWYQHPNVGKFQPPVGEGSKPKKKWKPCFLINGAVKVKVKKGGKLEGIRNDKSEDILMESIEVAKENLFSQVKPASGTRVVTGDGYVIRSEPVLALVKELKCFIEKKDVDGYWNFLRDKSKRAHLTAREKQLLQRAVIVEDGRDVFDITDDIADLLEDYKPKEEEECKKPLTKEEFFEEYKPLPDEQFFKENASLVEAKSEPVLALVKELRQCMGRKDVDGFRALLYGPKYETLSIDERDQVILTEMTEEEQVVDLIFEIDDRFYR